MLGSLLMTPLRVVREVRSAAMTTPQTDSPGVGVALATIGGVVIGVGAGQHAGTHQAIWMNVWFDSGCTFILIGVLLVVGALIPRLRGLRIHRLWRRQSPRAIPGAANGEDDPLLLKPLVLEVADESWHLHFGTVWVLGLAVCITNVTWRRSTPLAAPTSQSIQ